MNRDEALKAGTIKILQDAYDWDIESTAAAILNLFHVGMHKGETLTRLWLQSNAEERRIFLILIEATTSKGVCWLVDTEKDLPETQE